MGIISSIKSIFSKPKETVTATTTTKEIISTKATDYVGGGGKTETKVIEPSRTTQDVVTKTKSGGYRVRSTGGSGGAAITGTTGSPSTTGGMTTKDQTQMKVQLTPAQSEEFKKKFDRPSYESNRGTISNIGGGRVTNQQVYASPTLEQRKVESFKDPETGKEIPQTRLYFINPRGSESVGDISISEERPATEEEYEFFRSQPSQNELVIVPLSKTESLASSAGVFKEYKAVTGAVVGSYEKINMGLKQSITYPIAGGISSGIEFTESKTGLDLPSTLDEARQNIRESTAYLKSGNYPSFLADTGEFISGVGVGILEDVIEKPAKNVAIYGASFGIGFGASAITSGASAIPKVGATLGPGLKITQLGVGAVIGGGYVIKTISAASRAESPLQAGEIVGVSAKDFVVAGFGFKGGAKSYAQFEGYVRTLGREELIIQQGEYPQLNPNKQLAEFRKNIYPELGDKPGAFHTTSDKFWRDTIIPQKGTSELPGLYGSTQVSTPFARISGSSSGKFTFNFNDLISPPGKPGVAFLQPEGFRVNPAFRVSGGEFPFQFKYPARAGYADLPLIKSEIEALFRPEAGSYNFVSGKYFTRINNVRVPVDVFSYSGDVVSSTSSGGKLNLVGGSSSYNLPSSTYPSISFLSYRGSSSSSAVGSISSSTFMKTSDIYSPLKSISSGLSSSLKNFYSNVSRGSSSRGYSSFLTSIVPSSIIGKSSSRSSKSLIPKSYLSSKSIFEDFGSFPPSGFKPRLPFKDLEKPLKAKPKTARGRYAPSIAAIGLNIKAPKISGLYKKGFGALTLRPVIGNGKIKTKSKSKRRKDGRRKTNSAAEDLFGRGYRANLPSSWV